METSLDKIEKLGKMKRKESFQRMFNLVRRVANENMPGVTDDKVLRVARRAYREWTQVINMKIAEALNEALG